MRGAMVTAGAEWVVNGEGVATRKYDGSAYLLLDRQIWKRYDAKRGRIPPPDFMPAQLGRPTCPYPIRAS